LVVVCVGIENNGEIDVSTVTYGGQSMTKAVDYISGTSGFLYLCEIWYILEDDLPSDGSQTVTITCTGTAASMEINGFCAEYTGVAQCAPEATHGVSQTSGYTITNTISPSTDAWVISIVGSGNVGDFAHGQNQVEVIEFDDSSSTYAVAELRGANGETSLSSTYTGTINRLVRVCASFTKAVNYQLDLEVQWTSADYDEANEMLCIYGGTMGSENIRVDVWTGSAWQNLFTYLSSGWNNISVSSYLNSSTFTIRFKGNNETGDNTQDSWSIDATLLHVWTVETYDYVLKVVNQVTDNWQVNLEVYDSSNVGRLTNATISLYDGTSSDQIIVGGGSIIQSEGPLYDLAGNATIYIKISNLKANPGSTSYIYVHLKILVPDTSTYAKYVITFEIT
jgi:hypothetical protein